MAPREINCQMTMFMLTFKEFNLIFFLTHLKLKIAQDFELCGNEMTLVKGCRVK